MTVVNVPRLTSGVNASGLCAAITKSDTVNLAYVTRAIYVGGTGNIVAVFADGSTVTFSSIPAGSILPIAVIRVNSTNTTATNMVAMF
jgi:hypothetical protein